MMDHSQAASTPPPSATIQPLRGRNLIAIASGKGGVGKTWFSSPFRKRSRRWAAEILLFDGDLGLANVDIQLGLMPERDLGAVMSPLCHTGTGGAALSGRRI